MVRQGLALPEDGGKSDKLGLGGIQQDARQEKLQDGTPFLVRQVLEFIHHDKADVVDQLGIADQKGMELFIDDDGDVEMAAFDPLVVFPAVVGGDDGLDACLFVVFVKLLELFLGQSLGGDEIEDPLAAAAVKEREDLTDEGLAGRGDGGDEEVAAV